VFLIQSVCETAGIEELKIRYGSVYEYYSFLFNEKKKKKKIIKKKKKKYME